jgi:hypothetical protein
MDNGRVTFGFGFRTVQHSWLQSLRSIFYPEGEKIYPESVLRSLSPRSLAYWYFDDGHLDSGLPYFAVGSLTNDKFSSLLSLFGQRFSLDVYEKPASETNRLLGIRARSADAFFSLIKEYATPDLLYKLPPKHWPQGVLSRLPAKTKDALLLPKHLSDEAKQWGSLDADDKSGVPEILTYLMPGGGSDKPQTESVLCWPKGSGSTYSIPSEALPELPRCAECGRATPLSDLDQVKVCQRCLNTLMRVCWCGTSFRVRRKDHLFHDANCYAKYNRALHRQENPSSGVRVFKCQRCSDSWETPESGNFKFCPSCKEALEIVGRTKVCAYRHCDLQFVDTSTKNSMKFCRPEHQRREKLFRSGLAKDLSYFRT